MDLDNGSENENEVYMTGFLFSNIDTVGRLVDVIFDSQARSQLSSLARYNLICIVGAEFTFNAT